MIEFNRQMRQSKNITTVLIIHNAFTRRFVTSHEWEFNLDFQTTINCSYTEFKSSKDSTLCLESSLYNEIKESPMRQRNLQ